MRLMEELHPSITPRLRQPRPSGNQRRLLHVERQHLPARTDTFR